LRIHVTYVTFSARGPDQDRGMSRVPQYLSGIAAMVALTTGAGLAEASPRASERASVRPHVVYGCKIGQIWRTPGHHPVGLIVRGTAFRVVRYTPSKRWALGIARPASTKFQQHGWVRTSALCRTRPV
jgi:hypothetical protein